MNRIKIFSILVLCLLTLSCNYIRKKVDDPILVTYYNTGEKECECPINKFGEKEGICFCYFKDGVKKEITEWREDTIPINEQYIYYPNGKLGEYNFYNLIGEKRYSRFYDENGNIVGEMGDFLSHEILSSPKVSLGDSIVIDIYIASPPNCGFRVYGLDRNGRYNLTDKSEKKYIYRLVVEPSHQGRFVFVYEVSFVDSITTKVENRKSEVSFVVE